MEDLLIWIGIGVGTGLGAISLGLTLYDRRVYKRMIEALRAEIEDLKARYNRIMEWIRGKGLEPPDWG